MMGRASGSGLYVKLKNGDQPRRGGRESGDDFAKVFFIFAIFFVCFFFVFPALVAIFDGEITYIQRVYKVTDEDVGKVFFSFFAFMLGVLAYDAILKINRKVKPVLVFRQEIYVKESLSISFWVGLLIYLCYLVVGALDFNRAALAYDIRRGVENGSHLEFFLQIIFGVMKYALAFAALRVSRPYLALSILLVSLAVELYSAPGRVNVMVLVAVIVIVVVKLRAVFVAKASFVVLVVALPLVASLKGIIYDVSVNKTFPDLYEIYTAPLDKEVFFNNFAHPFVSLLLADGLVDRVGFRFGYDYLHAFLFYFKPFGFDVAPSLTYYNTDLIFGELKSIIPTGYLAFGYVQFWFSGVFIAGFSYRLVGIYAEYVYRSIVRGHNVEALKFYLAFLAANTFYHGELRTMILSFFFPVVVFHFLSKAATNVKREV